MARVPLALLALGLLALPARATGLCSPSSICVPGAPVAVAVGAGSVWVLTGSARAEQLLRLSPTDGRIQAVIPLARQGYTRSAA
jgi:hypothetical protein